MSAAGCSEPRSSSILGLYDAFEPAAGFLTRPELETARPNGLAMTSRIDAVDNLLPI